MFTATKAITVAARVLVKQLCRRQGGDASAEAPLSSSSSRGLRQAEPPGKQSKVGCPKQQKRARKY